VERRGHVESRLWTVDCGCQIGWKEEKRNLEVRRLSRVSARSRTILVAAEAGRDTLPRGSVAEIRRSTARPFAR
jgi:hypothetical protein